jgi:hydroxymethylbilane synthase
MTGRGILRLGTRGSELARTQSTTIAQRLVAAGFDVELTIIRTSGDRADAVPFASIGPQGVFVREIEQALVAREVDLAVHSFKDLPTTSPDELMIAAVPARFDPADLLLVHASALARADGDWLPLTPGARVGTASARRRVWLTHFRPDLHIQSLRGNVPTRIRKLQDGNHDAIVLAAAGVARLRADDRLGDLLTGLAIVRLDPERFVPAPAQGALAVQCRRDDAIVRDALAALDDAPSRVAVAAERDALARAEGGCDIAFGAYCSVTGASYELVAMQEHDGAVRTARVRGTDASALAAQLWPDFARGTPAGRLETSA